MTINRERVLELLEILKGSSASEIAVTDDDVTIRLARFQMVAAPEQGAAWSTAPEPVAVLGAAPVAPDRLVSVKARVVGLFYRGKQPGAEPLVQIGDEVKVGQALGMVEVLRKPTEVASPVAGTLMAVLAEEGHGVQYGDELFTIKPS